MAYIVKIDEKEFKCHIEKQERNFKVFLDNKEVQVEIAKIATDSLTLIIDNKPYQICLHQDNQLTINNATYSYQIIDEKVAQILKSSPEARHKKETIITAPMPGLVLEVAIKEGDTVKAGQGLLLVEAMKMQNEMKAPKDGTVKKILVKKGQTVNSNEALIVIE